MLAEIWKASGKHGGWFINFETLEELMDFIKKQKYPCIITEPRRVLGNDNPNKWEIIICDDWLE